jgi:hypothetical protein
MCNDISIHTQTMITCNQHTEFGFQASPTEFGLIIGKGGTGDTTAGSSVHVHLYDAEIVLPHLMTVLQLGHENLQEIARHPQPQVLRWPPPPGHQRHERRG